MRATRFLPRDSSKELTPEALDATLKSAFSSIGAPLHQNVLMFWSLLMSFRQHRDVGSLSRGSCFGDVCFVFATNVAIDSTRSSSAMSVGDVSLTAAKCTSEKVLRLHGRDGRQVPDSFHIISAGTVAGAPATATTSTPGRWIKSGLVSCSWQGCDSDARESTWVNTLTQIENSKGWRKLIPQACATLSW